MMQKNSVSTNNASATKALLKQRYHEQDTTIQTHNYFTKERFVSPLKQSAIYDVVSRFALYNDHHNNLLNVDEVLLKTVSNPASFQDRLLLPSKEKVITHSSQNDIRNNNQFSSILSESKYLKTRSADKCITLSRNQNRDKIFNSETSTIGEIERRLRLNKFERDAVVKGATSDTINNRNLKTPPPLKSGLLRPVILLDENKKQSQRNFDVNSKKNNVLSMFDVNDKDVLTSNHQSTAILIKSSPLLAFPKTQLYLDRKKMYNGLEHYSIHDNTDERSLASAETQVSTPEAFQKFSTRLRACSISRNHIKDSGNNNNSIYIDKNYNDTRSGKQNANVVKIDKANLATKHLLPLNVPIASKYEFCDDTTIPKHFDAQNNLFHSTEKQHHYYSLSKKTREYKDVTNNAKLKKENFSLSPIPSFDGNMKLFRTKEDVSEITQQQQQTHSHSKQDYTKTCNVQNADNSTIERLDKNQSPSPIDSYCSSRPLLSGMRNNNETNLKKRGKMLLPSINKEQKILLDELVAIHVSSKDNNNSDCHSLYNETDETFQEIFKPLYRHGLENHAGDNHCFLNVIIQCLWNIASFRNLLPDEINHYHVPSCSKFAEDRLISSSCQQKKCFNNCSEDIKENFNDVLKINKTSTLCLSQHDFSSHEPSALAPPPPCHINAKTDFLFNSNNFIETDVQRKSTIQFNTEAEEEKNSCVVCALKILLNKFALNTDTVLSPHHVRNALIRTFAHTSRFERGSMGDAEEAFEAILDEFHSLRTAGVNNNSYNHNNHGTYKSNSLHDGIHAICNPPCLAHKVFGLEFIDTFACSKCGEVLEPNSTCSYLYRLCVWEILYLIERYCKQQPTTLYNKSKNSQERKHKILTLQTIVRHLWNEEHKSKNSVVATSGQQTTETFAIQPYFTSSVSEAIDISSSTSSFTRTSFNKKRSDDSDYDDYHDCIACGGIKTLKTTRYCINPPAVFLLSLGWPELKATQETVTRILSIITSYFNFDKAFSRVRNKCTPLHNSHYILRGFVCYSYRHYVVFLFDWIAMKWVLYDDTQITELENWTTVVRYCQKGPMLPCILLYEQKDVMLSPQALMYTLSFKTNDSSMIKKNVLKKHLHDDLNQFKKQIRTYRYDYWSNVF